MAASHGTAVPVDEAITNVACLVSHALPDNQPNMEALAVSLGYNVSFDTNFGDRCAFVSGVSKYVEEAQSLATLVGGAGEMEGEGWRGGWGGRSRSRESWRRREVLAGQLVLGGGAGVCWCGRGWRGQRWVWRSAVGRLWVGLEVGLEHIPELGVLLPALFSRNSHPTHPPPLPIPQNDILEDGFRYSGMIYTWRSCSRAIPSVRPSLCQPPRLDVATLIYWISVVSPASSNTTGEA